MANLLSQNLSDGLFVFVLGILVIFFGITVIVLVVSLIGKIMSAISRSAKAKKQPQTEPALQDETVLLQTEGQAEDEARVAAIISACIAAYYEQEGNGCEFRIRKIKRI